MNRNFIYYWWDYK